MCWETKWSFSTVLLSQEDGDTCLPANPPVSALNTASPRTHSYVPYLVMKPDQCPLYPAMMHNVGQVLLDLLEEHSINFSLEKPQVWANTITVWMSHSPWTVAAQRNLCFALTWSLLYSSISNMSNVKLFMFHAELRGWNPSLLHRVAVG